MPALTNAFASTLRTPGAHRSRRTRPVQRGASLVVSLIMMLVITIMGLSATELALQSEKASRNLRDRQVALEAAQMALLDARDEIFGKGRRAHLFSDTARTGFAADCNAGTETGVGLCNFADHESARGWLMVDFRETRHALRQYARYGEFTGAILQTGAGSLTSHAPRYVIDVLVSTEMGGIADGTQKVLYRVTAVGFGVRDTTQVMLQTVLSRDV